jgi:hypothetical protein
LPRAVELKGVDAVRQRGGLIVWRNFFDNKEGRLTHTSGLMVTRLQSAASDAGFHGPVTRGLQTVQKVDRVVY